MEDIYKKVYAPVVVNTQFKRKAAQNHSFINGPRQGTKRQQTKAGVAVVTVTKPNYTPPKDSGNKAIWDGQRGGLTWSTTITNAMAPSKALGCQMGGPNCTGNADGIDHEPNFALAQSGLDQYKICDGKHHWQACYKEDALALYNNYDNTTGFKWSCTQCNSSKGGNKGLYENRPQWIEQCPGGCGYTFKGEIM